MLHITSARRIRDYRIWVLFDDGTEGEIDLKDKLQGSAFDSVQSLEFFKTFSVNPELETITWPNGADLAPEFLKAVYLEQKESY